MCKLGANVNLKENGGTSPLSFAVKRKFYAIVEILCAHGADVNDCNQSLLNYLEEKKED